jgi:hypothetical protein
LSPKTVLARQPFGVGDAGEACDANVDVAILNLPFATNEHSLNGVLYDERCDGDDDWEIVLRILANDVFRAIYALETSSSGSSIVN